MEFIKLLFGTILLRPYVFVFLLVYLFIAITHIGWKRTIMFTVIAYVVAFLCEWSSAVAGTGFPFGLYHYIDATRDRELWIAGVPFMDSLSFPFLAYTSWELAIILVGRLHVTFTDVYIENRDYARRGWGTSLMAAFLMMYLDIVIDPVALQGDRWFLGKIYEYPNGGSHFGITITNYFGWFFVCFVILRLFLLIEMILWGDGRGARIPVGVADYPFKAWFPIGLYFGILGFNLFMTFRIGETTMGWAGFFITLLLFVMLLLKLSQGRPGRW